MRVLVGSVKDFDLAITTERIIRAGQAGYSTESSR